MFTKQSVLFIVILLLSGNVLADCIYNGVSYPPDTVMGPYICDGTEWVLNK